MSKYVINDTTLTAIGDAVRSKGGTTELIPVSGLADAITNLPSGGGGEVEPIVLSGNCERACSGAIAGQYIKLFGNTISTSDLTKCSNMFNNNPMERLPFTLNLKAGNCSINYLFDGCANLTYIPDIDCKHSSYADITGIFSDCVKLETLPKVINAYPSSMGYFFYYCERLKEIPDDYFDTWNFSRMNSNKSASCTNFFSHCHSLRKVPYKIFEYYAPTETVAYYNCFYSNLFSYCFVLDEILNVPVFGEYTSNPLSSTFTYTHRLKRLTFATDNGVPKKAQWKGLTIDLTTYTGYSMSADRIWNSNAGITADKEVKNDATYQALKNDPDWFTTYPEYSTYNHDSAVETINSLPDTTEYGTNTIKFRGTCGSATDGGAINTLTADEIAVAAAKGWTISFI